ncbi:MAG: metallophosphoesterase [Flavobacteriales bacterium]|nr:metallophosphoesterase [Flavobacteriales bacterium]MCB9168468.1 metallophosphoesterase [Flavobacteriales bacterium]
MSNRAFLILIVVIAVLVLIDLYAYKGVSSALSSASAQTRRIVRIVYWATSLAMLGMLIWAALTFQQQRAARNYAFMFQVSAIFIALLLPKLVLVAFHGLEDVVQLVRWGWWKVAPSEGSSGEVLTRTHFLSRIGLIAAAVPLTGVLYGMTRGRRRFRVEHIVIPAPGLPGSFDGLRIVQISDLHLGSFEKESDIVRTGVDLVNAQEPDLILFTGDLVNDYADEATPWLDELARLHAPLGKYSILGNHDYSDYAPWDSAEAKAANMSLLQQHHERVGFRLMLDEHVALEQDGERIGLLGCQNWGRGFQQYGDLQKTMNGSESYPYRILMSHDPTHWDAQVLGTGIDLTLSGHTHGAQFGVRIAGSTYSPAQWIYKRWAGLYQEGGQHLYVNRGFGFIGFAGRVGMPPEITVLELQRT